MKIGLLDVDGHHFPNLPLMKLSTHHKTKGDQVEPFFALEKYDKVYVAKVFNFTQDYTNAINSDEIIHGGTGYDLDFKLPAEIEQCFPDYTLYPQFNEAYGFLTRGCPRKCGFCIVSKKEGTTSQQVADVTDFWNGQKTIRLLDPNILACQYRAKLLDNLINTKACIDFTQGLDIRLVDDEIIKLFKKLKFKILHFAWDNPKEDLAAMFSDFKSKTNIDFRRLRVYVLTNYNSTFDDDLYRVETLKKLGYDPYIMIYDKHNAPKQIRHLQRWVNNKWLFRSVEKFSDYKP